MIALFAQYPSVYGDLSRISWYLPRPAFHDYLQRLVRAGYGNRLMFRLGPVLVAGGDRPSRRRDCRGVVSHADGAVRDLRRERAAILSSRRALSAELSALGGEIRHFTSASLTR